MELANPALNYVHELSNLLLLSTIVYAIPWFANSLVPKATETKVSDTNHRTENKRIMVFDTIRGIAILAVILIHVTYFLRPNNLDIPILLLDALNASMRFAIPVFLIASGALLRPPKHSVKEYTKFYGDKMRRILVPYVVVALSVAFLAGLSPDAFLKGLFTGSISVPYYFVLVLFGLYLAYPFVESFAHKRQFVYITLLLTIGSQLLPMTWHIYGVPTFFQYLFFFVWGIYMRQQLVLEDRRTFDLRPWIIMIVLYITLFIIFPAHYYNIRPFFGTAMFLIMFVFFKRMPESAYIQKILANIGRHSLWVFLIHFPVMASLFSVLISKKPFVGTPFLILASILSVVVSLLVSYATFALYSFVEKLLRPIIRQRA